VSGFQDKLDVFPTKHTSRRSTAGRMTVFRAREVPLRDQISIRDIVTNIIRKYMSDSEKVSTKFVVKDITQSTIKCSPSRTGKRGTALVIFRGLVPEPFRAVMKSSEDSDVFANNSEDEEELSIDLDTKFIGATQLYEPQLDVEIVAEYRKPLGGYVADADIDA